jgi:hypothetical protein
MLAISPQSIGLKLAQVNSLHKQFSKKKKNQTYIIHTMLINNWIEIVYKTYCISYGGGIRILRSGLTGVGPA